MRLDPEKIYLHADGGRYRILELLKMKHPDSGEWLPAVSYEQEDADYNGPTYVRAQKDFVARFTPVSKP